MKKAVSIFSILIILASCSKDKDPVYEETVLFSEEFTTVGNWIPTPEQANYTPGTNCYRIEDGMLKLTFDHSLNDCGCGWVGAKMNTTVSNHPNKKNIGVRIKLNQGLFQEVLLGIPSQSGSAYSNEIDSKFQLELGGFNLTIPSSDYGKVPQGNTVNPWLNRYPGKSFEVIHENNGNVTFTIDGEEFSKKYINCYFFDSESSNLEMEFRLGHQPEFAPRTDQLWVEKIEIYTWDGPRPE
ncbi:MAG: hypothetical protein R2780_04640 [Crocinitomicaceae bacterium]|nr:hypothetical protein [Crocinitomicaceae bacterium]